MSIVRSIVEAHGGRLRVRSAVGAGTTVRVELPEAAPAAVAGRQTRLEPGATGRDEMLLLAEDDPFVRAVITTMFSELGYRVVAAPNGDALQDLHRQHAGAVALLVVDVDLPGRSGLEVLRGIRQGGDGVPAIVITGNPGLDSEALDSGSAMLRKPFRMTELANLVERLIHARRSKDVET